MFILVLALLSCYESIPVYYFDENFTFNFTNLTKNIRKSHEVQENVSQT